MDEAQELKELLRQKRKKVDNLQKEDLELKT
jgi:hypothetical protein